MREKIVSKLIKLRYSVYARVHPFIVLVGKHFYWSNFFFSHRLCISNMTWHYIRHWFFFPFESKYSACIEKNCCHDFVDWYADLGYSVKEIHCIDCCLVCVLGWMAAPFTVMKRHKNLAVNEVLTRLRLRLIISKCGTHLANSFIIRRGSFSIEPSESCDLSLAWTSAPAFNLQSTDTTS